MNPAASWIVYPINIYSREAVSVKGSPGVTKMLPIKKQRGTVRFMATEKFGYTLNFSYPGGEISVLLSVMKLSKSMHIYLSKGVVDRSPLYYVFNTDIQAIIDLFEKETVRL